MWYAKPTINSQFLKDKATGKQWRIIRPGFSLMAWGGEVTDVATAPGPKDIMGAWGNMA